MAAADGVGEAAALVREVVVRLEALHGRPERSMRFNPMDELVSCILSQHTNDSNSFPAFFRMKGAYPTWEAVVAAGAERIADVVRTAGLANQKARNIIACLGQIHRRTGAYSLDVLESMSTPDARNWLTDLPGVGPKTASIVLCFAMGRESIPVDTHIYRVSWRLGIIPEKAGEDKAHDLLLDLVPKDLAFRYHMDLIHHGRMVCKAPIPNCAACSLTDLCRWFADDGPARRKAELADARKRTQRQSTSKA